MPTCNIYIYSYYSSYSFQCAWVSKSCDRSMLELATRTKLRMTSKEHSGDAAQKNKHRVLAPALFLEFFGKVSNRILEFRVGNTVPPLYEDICFFGGELSNESVSWEKRWKLESLLNPFEIIITKCQVNAKIDKYTCSKLFMEYIWRFGRIKSKDRISIAQFLSWRTSIMVLIELRKTCDIICEECENQRKLGS